MTSQLGKKRTRNALNAEGEGRVLNGTFVPDLRQHIHKRGGLFLGESLSDIVDRRRRIAQASS